MERMFPFGPRIVRPRDWPVEIKINAVLNWEKAWLTLEGDRVEVVKNNLLKLLIDLFLLPENNAALPLNGRILELRVLQNVADDVHGHRDVFAEAFGVVNGLLAGGVGIKMSANIFDLYFERVLCPSAGSLESHMFKEVSGTVRLVGFCPGTRVNPHPNGRCLRMRLGFGRDSKTVRESRDFCLGPDIVNCRKRPSIWSLHNIRMDGKNEK